MKLYETINIKKGVTAFIGGGGKTSIIDKICHELYLEGKSV
ncbi:MAG TPA: putative selenium-dependent hydroxylase accessory protein YqeC, partial [Candidatus Fimicola cottocaccae]|nr:putative selenium-dependent hydroxylase accessory protein YqeC [Candidatus Fimicola cottocaccae]